MLEDSDDNEFEPAPAGDGDHLILNKGGLAELTGLTIKQIDAARREGLPVHRPARRGVELLFHAPTVIRWLLDRARQTDGLEAARRRQADAVARRAEAQADKITGELVDLETVTSAARDAAAVWRGELLSLPARCPAEARTVVTAEVNKLVNTIADRVEALSQ